MKFYIKQKVFSLRDTFYVMDETGKEVYQVQGKVFSLQNELDLLHMDGSVILNAKKKIVSVMSKYTICNPQNEMIAKVNRKVHIKPKFEIVLGDETLEVKGSFVGYTFGIYRDGEEVASIKKEVLTWADTYGIEIHDESQKDLYLFMVIIIDQILHEAGKKKGFNLGINI